MRRTRGSTSLIMMVVWWFGVFGLLLSGASAAADAALQPVTAQQASEDAAPAVIIVLDLSSAMNLAMTDDQSRLDVAVVSLTEVLPRLPEATAVGLRLVAGNNRSSCDTVSRLAAPISSPTDGVVANQLADVTASGQSSLRAALAAAQADLAGIADGSVWVFTAGLSTCPDQPPIPDPCAARSNRARIEVFALDADVDSQGLLRCLAEGAGGVMVALPATEDAQAALSGALLNVAQIPVVAPPMGAAVTGGPTLERAAGLDAIAEMGGENIVRFLDTLTIDQELWYRTSPVGLESVSFTATVFGAPDVAGVVVAQQICIGSGAEPSCAQQQVNGGAGPRRQALSVRCANCVPAEAAELFWKVSLSSDVPRSLGRFPLELRIETSSPEVPDEACYVPHSCWFEREIIARSAELSAIEEQIAARLAGRVPSSLLDQKALLEAELAEVQEEMLAARLAADIAAAHAGELDEQLALNPRPSGDYGFPVALGALGFVLAAGAVGMARRRETSATLVGPPVGEPGLIALTDRGGTATSRDREPLEPTAENPKVVVAPTVETTPAAAVDTDVANAAAGDIDARPRWRIDENGNARERWWDGEEWTRHVRDQRQHP